MNWEPSSRARTSFWRPDMRGEEAGGSAVGPAAWSMPEDAEDAEDEDAVLDVGMAGRLPGDGKPLTVPWFR
ncbi:hypothetical protein GCM10010231_53320 [Streptomyces sindenensis]|nr:hypothetical protein GCM10010231_53320 [Streptomyces sindenensis]